MVYGTAHVVYGTAQVVYGTAQVVYGTAQVVYGTAQVVYGIIIYMDYTWHCPRWTILDTVRAGLHLALSALDYTWHCPRWTTLGTTLDYTGLQWSHTIHSLDYTGFILWARYVLNICLTYGPAGLLLESITNKNNRF